VVAQGVAIAKVVDQGQEPVPPVSVRHPRVRASKDAAVRRVAESAVQRAGSQALVPPPPELRSSPQAERLAPVLSMRQLLVSPRLGEPEALLQEQAERQRRAPGPLAVSRQLPEMGL
jgi:hypothetical protein